MDITYNFNNKRYTTMTDTFGASPSYSVYDRQEGKSLYEYECTTLQEARDKAVELNNALELSS